MTSEKVVEQIEKLIDEKLRQVTILNSKTLGENKELFFNESRKKIVQIKADLVEALKNPLDWVGRVTPCAPLVPKSNPARTE